MVSENCIKNKYTPNLTEEISCKLGKKAKEEVMEPQMILHLDSDNCPGYAIPNIKSFEVR